MAESTSRGGRARLQAAAICFAVKTRPHSRSIAAIGTLSGGPGINAPHRPERAIRQPWTALTPRKRLAWGIVRSVIGSTMPFDYAWEQLPAQRTGTCHSEFPRLLRAAFRPDFLRALLVGRPLVSMTRFFTTRFERIGDVCFGPIADIGSTRRDVCFCSERPCGVPQGPPHTTYFARL
jgi:hypothetical protein